MFTGNVVFFDRGGGQRIGVAPGQNCFNPASSAGIDHYASGGYAVPGGVVPGHDPTSGLSTDAIIGIAVGGGIVLLIAIVAVCSFAGRRSRASRTYITTNYAMSGVPGQVPARQPPSPRQPAPPRQPPPRARPTPPPPYEAGQGAANANWGRPAQPPRNQLPAGWQQEVDAGSGQAYYFNPSTGETQFERPVMYA